MGAFFCCESRELLMHWSGFERQPLNWLEPILKFLCFSLDRREVVGVCWSFWIPAPGLDADIMSFVTSNPLETLAKG